LPVSSYPEVEFENNQIIAAGKSMTLNPAGLPESVKLNGKELFDAPMRFMIVLEDKEIPVGGIKYALI
ncbi:MAG: hypothetical protein ACRCSQ_05875, partial [Bacteroidales bacterium]